jgi:hypothetical protein
LSSKHLFVNEVEFITLKLPSIALAKEVSVFTTIYYKCLIFLGEAMVQCITFMFFGLHAIQNSLISHASKQGLDHQYHFTLVCLETHLPKGISVILFLSLGLLVVIRQILFGWQRKVTNHSRTSPSILTLARAYRLLEQSLSFIFGGMGYKFGQIPQKMQRHGYVILHGGIPFEVCNHR